jgi:hypothetical protein
VFFKKKLGKKNMKITKNVGFLLLGIWLIITGLLQVVELPIPSIDVILSILAIASGVMIVLGK